MKAHCTLWTFATVAVSSKTCYNKFALEKQVAFLEGHYLRSKCLTWPYTFTAKRPRVTVML